MKRTSLYLVPLLLALSACASAPARSAEAPCPPQQGTLALGFEHATTGNNELPIGFFCGMDQPAPRVSQVEVKFTPYQATDREVVPATVVHRPAARVLEADDGPGLRFDYVIEVAFHRAGNWLMDVRYHAPWSTQPLTATMLVPVKEKSDRAREHPR